MEISVDMIEIYAMIEIYSRRTFNLSSISIGNHRAVKPEDIMGMTTTEGWQRLYPTLDSKDSERRIQYDQ